MIEHARTPLAALKDAINLYDSQAQFGEAIGKNQGFVSMLLHRVEKGTGKVAPEIGLKIEEVTGGVVTRWDLCPDFPWQAAMTPPRQPAAVS